ncbi:hypothetical protein LPJ66_005867 [Kickxella alabastrina]|uniref:Uncharacterized protein n=1 Tax=Kickxella alabastrina TaxID=61397 RepID=A0ACC1IDW8_9FUNG|nr:hypothetical protein LPJ66_005867 [Kickxella alabastrina]
MATPRTHAIFEEMDFPDAFSNNTAQHQPPPEKRQRTNSMSERFFEIPTGSTSSSPAESTGQRTPRKTSAAMNKAPGAAAAAAGGKSAEVKRKVPAAAAAASNGSGSQMMSSNGSMVGRLTSNSKSLERMGQESEYAGLSIENLMRMFTPSQQGQQQQHNQQQGQGDISVDYLPLSTSNATKLADFLPPASGIPTHTNVAGSMAVGDSAAAHSQAIGFPVHGSESTDQLAHLLSADDFNNLTMLSNSGVAAAGEAAVPPVGSGANLAANMFDGAGLASLFEYMANQPAAAAATNMHVGIGGGGGGGDAYESSFMGNVSGGGSGQAYGTQWLVDALKSLTPEQQQSMYNYYKNAGHVNHVPLLTAESQDSMDIGSGADGSSFLEFVDPNAENIEGGSGGSSSSSVGAVGDLGIADISSSVSTSGMGSAEDDYGILFKEALGSDIVGLPGVHAADSASTDAAGSVVDVSGIHPDLAATLFHTSPVVAPTSDVLDMLNSPGLSLVATSSVQSEPSDM